MIVRFDFQFHSSTKGLGPVGTVTSRDSKADESGTTGAAGTAETAGAAGTVEGNGAVVNFPFTADAVEAADVLRLFVPVAAAATLGAEAGTFETGSTGAGVGAAAAVALVAEDAILELSELGSRASHK